MAATHELPASSRVNSSLHVERRDEEVEDEKID